VLQIKELKKKFGDKILFDGCSLSVNKGERIALIGPNGAGKTTLFRIIMGDEQPDSGEMIIQKDISIGLLPQEVDVKGFGPDGRSYARFQRDKGPAEKDGRIDGQAFCAGH